MTWSSKLAWPEREPDVHVLRYDYSVVFVCLDAAAAVHHGVEDDTHPSEG